MEKYAWTAKVKEGCIDEYIKRHNEIWQELKDVLKIAGIKNYTIWADGNTLFGYYECETGVKHALEVQKESPIIAKWNDFMKDILVMDIAPDGGQPKLKQVFSFR